MLSNMKLITILTMLITGTMITLLVKYLGIKTKNKDSFIHPYFLTSLMFFGESLCIFLHKYQNRDSSLNYYYSIPAFFDFCSSTLSFIALSLVPASVYQMMRGFLIIIVSFYSKYFLKERIFPHQHIGFYLVFLGLSIVGLSNLNSSSETAKNPIFGIFLLILSQFFSGGIFVSEQFLMKKCKTDPFQVVGVEGLSGVFYYLLLLPILNFIPCHDRDLCNNGYIENTVEALKEISRNTWLGLTILQYMISVTLFNVAGVNLTKSAGAVTRSTVDTSRTVIIWVFGLMSGWEKFSFLQLIGFMVLLVGTFVYNEVLVVEYFGIRRSVNEKKLFMEKTDFELVPVSDIE